MSTYYLILFGLISFLFLASINSCSSLFLPLNGVSYNEDDQYYPVFYNNEDNLRYISPNDLSFLRHQRSSPYYPRANRNTWFRVATYQHFKPAASEETPSGDHLMRWGR
jgi:hypothetical protein